jgi:hypothetical protein
MDTIFSMIIGLIIIGGIMVALYEYRIRQPDYLVLYESKGRITLRKSLLYPRHFSLLLKRTTCPRSRQPRPGTWACA